MQDIACRRLIGCAGHLDQQKVQVVRIGDLRNRLLGQISQVRKAYLNNFDDIFTQSICRRFTRSGFNLSPGALSLSSGLSLELS